MKLVIAEKPSLARNVLDAIPEDFMKRDGYYKSHSYYVSYGFGHLFGLLDMEEYFPESKNQRWTMDNLPFFPDEFRFGIKKDPKTKTVDAGVEKQFEILKTLMNQEDVDGIIHCGDADREGEVIIRLIILFGLQKQKTVYRLWLPEQTADSIRNALDHLTLDSEYDNLYNEGLSRTYIDWLYGINFTRYATLKGNSLYRVGRVLTPIVKAIYDREKERREFTPVQFLKIQSVSKVEGLEIKLIGSTTYSMEEKALVTAYCKQLNEADAVVTKVEKKEQKRAPGKLFSLSKLQGTLGKKYKMSLKDSLAIIQDLYEKGYVTYPRTNTEYLAENEKQKIDKIIDALSKRGYHVTSKSGKKIYDDSKIESHSALTPTLKIASKEMLSEAEWNVYHTILSRFLSVFCSEECIVEKTTIYISCVEQFKASGNVIKQKGFLEYEPSEKNDDVLPYLNEGDLIAHDFRPVQKETKPPQSYNTETLSNYLKNPFRGKEKSESDDEDYRAILSGVEIGTEATRTGIIENAINSGYISLNNNVYSLESKGEQMIHLLQALEIDISVETSVYLSKLLKKVYHGEQSLGEVVGEAEKRIAESFHKRNEELPDGLVYKSEQKEIGICPKCGAVVVETVKAFLCSNHECKFALWKTGNKYFESIGLDMNEKIATDLLAHGKTFVKDLKSKNGKLYNAIIIGDFSEKFPKWRMEFPPKKKNSYRGGKRR